MMQIRTVCILIQILKDYLDLLEATKIKVNDRWVAYFTKQELLSIITSKNHESSFFAGDIPPYRVFMSNVGTEDRIIAYMLKKLEEVVQQDGIVFETTHLKEVLSQLGLETHYLAEKRMAEYDEYDISNLRALLRKAGWMYPVWGFFDSDNNRKDQKEITSRPIVFYDTKSEAREILTTLVKEKYFTPENVTILTSELIINPKSF
ncbi:MAG: hypothetical protein KG003_15075 [Bacteroidetes bacterium]|nr:hypothetical protein [Bacteroidota bacterium]